MKKIQLGGYIKGSRVGGYALVDDEDFVWLNKKRWSISSYGYAIRQTKKNEVCRVIFMAHEIMGNVGGFVDHINNIKLDNQRKNLRSATRTENNRNVGIKRSNTSGYKGVSFRKDSGSFRAYIMVDRKMIHLGSSYRTPKEAALIYNAAAIKYHGNFACLNNI